MQRIKELNQFINEKLNLGCSEAELNDLLYTAEELFKQWQSSEESDVIIPYEILLLEHNIIKLKSILEPVNTDGYNKAK